MQIQSVLLSLQIYLFLRMVHDSFEISVKSPTKILLFICRLCYYLIQKINVEFI